MRAAANEFNASYKYYYLRRKEVYCVQHPCIIRSHMLKVRTGFHRILEARKFQDGQMDSIHAMIYTCILGTESGSG